MVYFNEGVVVVQYLIEVKQQIVVCRFGQQTIQTFPGVAIFPHKQIVFQLKYVQQHLNILGSGGFPQEKNEAILVKKEVLNFIEVGLYSHHSLPISFGYWLRMDSVDVLDYQF